MTDAQKTLGDFTYYADEPHHPQAESWALDQFAFYYQGHIELHNGRVRYIFPDGSCLLKVGLNLTAHTEPTWQTNEEKR